MAKFRLCVETAPAARGTPEKDVDEELARLKATLEPLPALMGAAASSQKFEEAARLREAERLKPPSPSVRRRTI